MLWFETALLPAGWGRDVRIDVRNGVIARVKTGVPALPGDERHEVALPGLSNVHSHAFQRGMAGLAETRGPVSDNFWTWREVMYHFLDRLTPDDLEAITSLAYLEMLERGFTRVGEFHYLHNDPAGVAYADPAELAVRIVAAAEHVGIGLTLLPVFYAHADFGGASPKAGQRRFITDPESFARLVDGSRKVITSLPDANIGIAPHSLRAVTPKELGQIVPLARGGPVHIHAAEQIKEVDDCLAWCGARPVEWLLDHADIDNRWCLVHATHMTEQETMRFAQSGAVAGLCPITEANLGDGVFPARPYLETGGHYGIGTDSNVRIGAAEELGMLEYAQRLVHRARNLWPQRQGESTGRTLLGGALSGGAQALGQPEGGLRVGASADFFSLGADDPALAGRRDDAILDSWIFAGAAIDCVWRRGKKLVSAGRHCTRQAIVTRYSQVLHRLLAA